MYLHPGFDHSPNLVVLCSHDKGKGKVLPGFQQGILAHSNTTLILYVVFYDCFSKFSGDSKSSWFIYYVSTLNSDGIRVRCRAYL